MNQNIGWNKDGFLIIANDYGSMIFTNKNIRMIDIYGNTLTINNVEAVYKQNSPTYYKLYEHWLKTTQND